MKIPVPLLVVSVSSTSFPVHHSQSPFISDTVKKGSLNKHCPRDGFSLGKIWSVSLEVKEIILDPHSSHVLRIWPTQTVEEMLWVIFEEEGRCNSVTYITTGTALLVSRVTIIQCAHHPATQPLWQMEQHKHCWGRTIGSENDSML